MGLERVMMRWVSWARNNGVILGARKLGKSRRGDRINPGTTYRAKVLEMFDRDRSRSTRRLAFKRAAVEFILNVTE